MRYTPAPPSMDVLTAIVESTKPRASVIRAKDSPLMFFARNTMLPTHKANRAASNPLKRADGTVGHSSLAVSDAIAYTPRPKNAPCPNEK